MRDPLLKSVKEFLSLHLLTSAPLLLGYSGGPDSKALLHLLLACRTYFNFDLHLAHVNHGWRAESGAEAALLREEAESLQLPFHLKTVEPGLFEKGNLEEQAREIRLKFFAELYEELHCQALLLAHQADDHAESVLKRVCEGAHFSKLFGLSVKSCLRGMQVWRPLLFAQKKELIDWLNTRDLSFLNDPTNSSPQFLRGRMRTGLLPLLEEGFGKQIVSNLCHLGEMSEKLKEYFQRKLSLHLHEIAADGYLELDSRLEEIELQFLLKEWFAREKITVSRQVMAGIIAKAIEGSSGKFTVTPGWVYIDCGRISISIN